MGRAGDLIKYLFEAASGTPRASLRLLRRMAVIAGPPGGGCRLKEARVAGGEAREEDN